MNIDNFIKNIDINNDEYIIVGVSAGPDSMALLHMLQKNLNCKLVCAHINHNVRPESNEEEIAPLLGENVQAEDEDVSDIPINIWILIAVIIGVILLIIWIIYLIKTKESRKRKRERKRIFRESKKRFKRRKRIRH